MGTFTSQFLIGNAHPYEGGIYGITHTLYLSENSRPTLVLQETAKANKRKVTWIPTLENMLEDTMLMIGLYVFKDEQLIELKDKYFHNCRKDWVELYGDVKMEHLQMMYARCREIEERRKVLLSVFAGSSLEKHLPVLKKYHCDLEVCLSVYRKEYSVWTGTREERGDGSRSSF